MKIDDNNLYAPHITLARCQAPPDPSLISLDPKNYSFSTDEFGLYQSEPTPNKLGKYTLLKSFRLSA